MALRSSIVLAWGMQPALAGRSDTLTVGSAVTILEGPYSMRQGVISAIRSHGVAVVSLGDGERATVPLAAVLRAGAAPGGAPTGSGAGSPLHTPPPIAVHAAAPPRAPTSSVKRTLDSVPADERRAVCARHKVRVIDREHALVRRVVDVKSLHDTSAAVAIEGSSTEHVVALSGLEVLPETSAASSVGAETADRLHSKASFQTGDAVDIVGGPRSGAKGPHHVIKVMLDEKYEVWVGDAGAVATLDGAHLRKCTPRYAQRPTGPMQIPAGPKDGQLWNASQRRALRLALEEIRNILLTGEPGAGKTEVQGVAIKVLQANKYKVLVMGNSNSIVAFLMKRLESMGVLDVKDILGTYSSKSWASLGPEYAYDRVTAIVGEMLSQPWVHPVIKAMREAHAIVLEEAQNQLPQFYHIHSMVFNLICGHKGPESYANKLVIAVMDERQLSGIQVNSGLARKTTAVLAPGGSQEGGGEAATTLSFESPIFQSFVPAQPVSIAAAHFATSDAARIQGFVVGGTGGRDGVVLRWCPHRERYLVSCHGASQLGLRGFGSEEVVKVEMVCAEHLTSLVATNMIFVEVHLLSSFRVQQGSTGYNDALPPAMQDKYALWHRAVKDLHNGNPDTPDVRELVRRLEDVGERMFDERPEKYDVTTFIFLTNRGLEDYAKREHVQRFTPGRPWRHLDQTVMEHHAMKCNSEGKVFPKPECMDWNDRGSNGDGGSRQFLAGAVAGHLHYKLGYELVIGTFPQFLFERGKTLKIPIGEGKDHGYVRPGMRAVVVGSVEGNDSSTHNGVTYPMLVVEFPDLGWVAEARAYPKAALPVLMYKSQELYGRVLHWLQYPVKYGMLSTAHSRSGRSYKWLMHHWEVCACRPWRGVSVVSRSLCTACLSVGTDCWVHPSCVPQHFWCFDAAFSGLTRAVEPPVKVGDSLADVDGACGLMAMNNLKGDLFDPTALPLGLHPKTALRFKHLYDKPVPQAAVDAASKWVGIHNKFHLTNEAEIITMFEAREGIGPDDRELDGS